MQKEREGKKKKHIKSDQKGFPSSSSRGCDLRQKVVNECLDPMRGRVTHPKPTAH